MLGLHIRPLRFPLTSSSTDRWSNGCEQGADWLASQEYQDRFGKIADAVEEFRKQHERVGIAEAFDADAVRESLEAGAVRRGPSGANPRSRR